MSSKANRSVKDSRLCITWLKEQVGRHLAEQESLKTNSEALPKGTSVLESASSNEKHSELELELAREMKLIVKSLKKEEAGKIDAIETYKEKKSSKQDADSSLAVLIEELEKVRDELKIVQAFSRKLPGYNTSIQQYNGNPKEGNVKHQKLLQDKNYTNKYICSPRLQLAASQSSQERALNQGGNLEDQLHTATAAHSTACGS